MWLHDLKCQEVVSKAWERGLLTHSGFPLFNFLKACREDLTVWNKRDFGHVGRQIPQLQQKLQILETSGMTSIEDLRAARQDLKTWLDTNKIMWKQHSRNTRLKLGDKNTIFFHTKASLRKALDSILGLNDPNGVW